MSLTDPIADMLTRIRNAHKAQFENVEMPSSRIKQELAKILKKEGYINDFEELLIPDKKYKNLKIKLKYIDSTPAIKGLKRVSKPSLRVYVTKNRIPRVFGSGMGISIISTSKGMMTDVQARYFKIGGELLCQVW